MLEQARRQASSDDQVVIALPRHEDLRPVTLEPPDQVLAEKPGPAGDRDRLSDQNLFIESLRQCSRLSGYRQSA